jgi:hypothetical protein
VTKQSGLGDNLWVDGVDLSGDIGSLAAIGGGNSPLDVTGIDKSAHERLGGKLDGRIEFSAFFNDDPGPPARAHQTLKTRPTTDRLVTYCRGTVLGAETATLVGKQINYDPTRGEDGSLTLGVQALANALGLTWAKLSTAGKRTDAAPTNGAGIDNGAASTFGLRAFAHVFAFTGTNVTIAIQESQDNGGGDAYATAAGGFAVTQGITAVGAYQFVCNNTAPFAVERWLRVVTTGTFSSVTFAVVIERWPVAATPQ